MNETTKMKSIKSRIFRFKEGQIWDDNEEIVDYISELLLDFDEWNNNGFPKVKQKTYITIQCKKEILK